MGPRVRSPGLRVSRRDAAVVSTTMTDHPAPRPPVPLPVVPPPAAGLSHPLALHAAIARGVSEALKRQSDLVDTMARSSLPPGSLRDSWVAAARIAAGGGERFARWVEGWVAAFAPRGQGNATAAGDD